MHHIQINEGSAVAWWLMPRTPDPEVGGSSPTRVKLCCVLERGTFTPQKVLVIPRKRWLRPNMTEKLFTGTLRINQQINENDIRTHTVVVYHGAGKITYRDSFKQKANIVNNMSLVVRNPVFGVFAQVRYKPGCTATEDG